MPYLMNTCDIYAAPSRLEGFGMPQVEAGACGKAVLGINAMAMKETLVHGETAFLAGVATEVVLRETIVGEESGWEKVNRKGKSRGKISRLIHPVFISRKQSPSSFENETERAKRL